MTCITAKITCKTGDNKYIYINMVLAKEVGHKTDGAASALNDGSPLINNHVNCFSAGAVQCCNLLFCLKLFRKARSLPMFFEITKVIFLPEKEIFDYNRLSSNIKAYDQFQF